jgi:polyferredoxin
MIKQQPLRQRTRQALIIGSFLLFPIIMNFFSPYVIIDGASQGIVNGSFIVFGSLFIAALFFGRLWCGWACPVGGLGEISFGINDRPVTNKKLDWAKWFIWAPWIVLIAAIAISAGGYHSVNFLLDTQNGISVAGDVDRPIIFAYVIYYGVVGIFLALSIFAGRRAGCHTICWMAPFMILGRKLRNWFGWPALRLKADASLCGDCKKCTTNCPMSLDVNGMVKLARMENGECILCGTCVDGCPKKVIGYSFSAGK